MAANDKDRDEVFSTTLHGRSLTMPEYDRITLSCRYGHLEGFDLERTEMGEEARWQFNEPIAVQFDGCFDWRF